jgi:hypothetical protein
LIVGCAVIPPRRDPDLYLPNLECEKKKQKNGRCKGNKKAGAISLMMSNRCCLSSCKTKNACDTAPVPGLDPQAKLYDDPRNNENEKR